MIRRIKEWILAIRAFRAKYVLPQRKELFGRMPSSSKIIIPATINGAQNIYFDENVSIGTNSILFAPIGRIFIKKCSYSGPRLYIGTGNHLIKEGYFSRLIDLNLKQKLGGANLDWDVTIEEDVWMGENVSILCKKVGRGSIIAAGAVVVNDVPPYAVVGGVPAKFIKFHFTIEEIIKHESVLYNKEDRLKESYLRTLFDTYRK